MKVFTLRRNFKRQSFGYETTQAYRHKTFNEMGISNAFLVSTPFIGVCWWKFVQSLGFDISKEKFVILPHLFSDLNDRVHSVNEETFEESILPKLTSQPSISITSGVSGKTYEFADFWLDTLLTSDGHVARFIKRNKSLKIIEESIVTNGLFYTDFKDGSFQYYRADGSIVLKGSVTGKKRTHTYNLVTKPDSEITEAMLIEAYLNGNANSGDLVINDQSQERDEDVLKFCQIKGLRYLDVLHFNIYYALENKLLKKIQPHLPNLLVASPHIIKDLADEGISATFVPPMGIDVQDALPVGLTSNKFLLVGNFTKDKRLDLALQAFAKLPDLSLDIYGGTLQEYKQFYPNVTVPDNVTFKGLIPTDKIPRNAYLGYLSCSASEMFGNAMVESMGVGNVPVLSNVDYAHRPVGQALGTPVFETAEELEKVLKDLYCNTNQEEKENLSRRVLNYAKENFGEDKVKQAWLKVIEDETLTN